MYNLKAMNGEIIFNNHSGEPDNSAGKNGQEDASLKGVFPYPLQRLIKKYQAYYAPPPIKEKAAIHVDEIASKIAYLYERIRKIIDWKEENLLRRNAIERILKRSLISELSKINFVPEVESGQIAEPLVLELIRGGHLPNDEIPVQKIDEVKTVLEKYIFFIKNAPFPANSSFPIKKRINFYDWVLEIAACEIEEVLAPPVRENALIETMTVLLNERTRIIPEGQISQEDQLIQTYIACHRTLFDLDDSIITYHLLKYRFSNWLNPTPTGLEEINKNIFSIWEAIGKELTHPLGREFFNIAERIDTVFTLLADVFDFAGKESLKISETIIDRQNFSDLLARFYQKRYKTLKSRLFKLAIFSTLSVFVSNWFTFFIVEVPLAKLFCEGFNPLAAAIDFIVPSLAMFVLVAIIRPPGASNLKKVIETTFSFIYPDEEKEIYEIKIKKKRRPLTSFIIFLIYTITCLATFWAVAWIFYKATLPITSVIFDTLTIAINVFAALAIRNKSREITVEDKTSFWEFLIDIVSLPVAEVGSWLAKKWKEYNVVSVFFNVVVEMPFVTVIKFVEDWRNFLKEKKAEMH